MAGGWTVTSDLERYLAEAGELLYSDPVANTLPLGIAENLTEHGLRVYGPADPVFGWWCTTAGIVQGAFLQTPPFPLLLTSMPGQAVDDLADLLSGRQRAISGVNAADEQARAFAAAWTARSGAASEVNVRLRLYRLESLIPPDPAPPGMARTAGTGDRGLVLAWHQAFNDEAHARQPVNTTIVDDRLSRDSIALWEVGGMPVSMAARSGPVANVARIAPVYTPPEHRRRGFGTAVTAAVTQAALDAGAGDVALFTDLANPVSNSIYQQIGFRPVADRLVLTFTS